MPLAGYDWKIFTEKGDIAYKEYLKGNKELVKYHNIVADGEKEIRFIIDIDKELFHITPKGKVLDVACGTGYMTHCFKELGFETIGFDLSEDAITIARNNFPEINFFSGDGSTPLKYFNEPQFDLIHIREFHPLSRIDDFDYQIGIIKDYLNILHKNGLIVIAHARRGWGINCKSLNFKKVRYYFKGTNITTTGPYFYFLFKHLKISLRYRFVLWIVSSLTIFLSFIAQQRWIEYFLIHRADYLYLSKSPFK